VGTETDGSVVCPSHANGIVGLKPTVGLVSRSGIIPISHSQDTAGPMARTVADTAVLLQAMAGEDPQDKADLGFETPGDYLAMLDVEGLRGARIGVARNFKGFGAAEFAILEKSVERMRDLGATIVDPANIETEGQLSEPEYVVLTYEFKAGLDAYLGRLGPKARVHSMADVIAFNEANRETMMPYFGQEHFIASQLCGPLTDEVYLQALAECRKLARDEGIDATIARHNLDAIVALTGSPAWPTDWVNGDHYLGGSSSPAAVAGYPSISVPAGYVFGLPVNISFIAGAWQESKLIRLAYVFEQATQVRRPPQFLQTVDFS
jgi:amidase